MMFNWLTYCLIQWKQYKHRSTDVMIRLINNEMWDVSEKEWEDIILKLKDEMKEKL